MRPDARARREAARQRSGEFGPQAHTPPDPAAETGVEDLAHSDPAELDRRLEALARDHATAEQRLELAWTRAHQDCRDRRQGRRSQWGMTRDQVRERLEAAPAGSKQAEALELLGQAEAAVAEASSRMAPLEAEYERRPWPRFFLAQSHDGHIHSSRSCSTCNRGGSRTAFSWLPDLSGKGEADAVREHGPMLCSVCFPTAPVEWRTPEPAPADDGVCPGSGRPADEVLAEEGRRRGYAVANGGMCTVCGEWASETTAGRVRKHRRPAG